MFYAVRRSFATFSGSCAPNSIGSQVSPFSDSVPLGFSIILPLLTSSLLSSPPLPSSRSTILVVLDTKGTPIKYEPGDHAAIYPQNNSKLVAELLERIHSPFEPDEPIFLESRRVSEFGTVSWVGERRLPVPFTLKEALTSYLDITTPPTPQFLKLLSQQTTRASDKEELEELAEGGRIYEDWKFECYPNLLDVINQFHSLKVNASLLLQELPMLQCVSSVRVGEGKEGGRGREGGRPLQFIPSFIFHLICPLFVLGGVGACDYVLPRFPPPQPCNLLLPPPPPLPPAILLHQLLSQGTPK